MAELQEKKQEETAEIVLGEPVALTKEKPKDIVVKKDKIPGEGLRSALGAKDAYLKDYELGDSAIAHLFSFVVIGPIFLAWYFIWYLKEVLIWFFRGRDDIVTNDWHKHTYLKLIWYAQRRTKILKGLVPESVWESYGESVSKIQRFLPPLLEQWRQVCEDLRQIERYHDQTNYNAEIKEASALLVVKRQQIEEAIGKHLSVLLLLDAKLRVANNLDRGFEEMLKEMNVEAILERTDEIMAGRSEVDIFLEEENTD